MKNYKGNYDENIVKKSKNNMRELKKALILFSCGVIALTTAYVVYGNGATKVSSNSDFSYDIDFDYSDEEYEYHYDDIKYDFKNIEFVKGLDRLFIKDNALCIKYPLEASGIGNSGAMINSNIKESNEYTMEYDIFFDGNGSSFNWQDGGMLSGLAGGKFYNGTEDKVDKDGFHALLAYNNLGEIYPYIYTSNDSAAGAKVYNKIASLQENRWNKIKIYVKVNDEKEDNGIFKVWINENLCFNEENIRFTLKNDKISICNLSAYNTETNITTNIEQFVYIDNYKLYSK